MAETVDNTDSLHRRTFVKYLNQVAPQLGATLRFAQELNAIASDWDTFSANLRDTSKGTDIPNLEASSRRLRRLTFREEHFWGDILENVKEE